MRQKLLQIIHMHFFLFATVPIVSGTQTLTERNVVEISNFEYLEIENRNHKIFHVDVDQSGRYYASFWMCPARYPNGELTRYEVYINGTLCDSLLPEWDNWQSSHAIKCLPLRLNEGTNEISISTACPEFPDVSFLRISSNNEIVKSTGTSLAAPQAAGVAAMILERNPDLSNVEVHDIICGSTKGDGTWNQKTGWGIIDAYKAITNTPKKW